MPCPHNEITIVQRSQRQSAVAAAAYQSGEKLFCEYDQQVKHYPEKRGMSALTKIKQDTFLSKFILISNPSRRWNRSLPDLSRRDGSLNNTI